MSTDEYIPGSVYIPRSREDLKIQRQRKQVRDAFMEKFPNPKNDLVLACIADENFAHRTTFHTDARIHALNEGRRQAWLQLQHMLKLTPSDLESLARTTENMRNE